MKPRNGFGFHIDFAHRMLALSVDVAPAGLEDRQIRVALPDEIGEGGVELTHLGAGTGYLSFSCNHAREETSMRAAVPPHHMALPFHLLPEPVEVGIEDIAAPIPLHQSDSYILGPSAVATQNIHPGLPVRQLAVYLDAQTIESCFEDRQQAPPAGLKRAFTHAEGEPFYLPGRATTAMGLALRQMLTCSLRGGIARLYLEAKVLEIAALRLAQLGEQAHTPKHPRLMRSDIDRLEEARAVLLARCTDPPTITELSHSVGLNRTKLKVGFKERFGTTVFGFVRQQRMQRALLLLCDGECNVYEAALAVGYNSVSAFAAAFRAAFGFSPRLVRGCKDVTELNGSEHAV